MIARVHTLDVPITKEPEVLNCARGWLAKFRQTAGGERPIDIRCTAARVPAHSVSVLATDWCVPHPRFDIYFILQY